MSESKYTKYDKKYSEMLTALDLLPVFYEYDKEDLKTLSDVYLSLDNPKAFINFIILFSGKNITIPNFDDVEITLKLIMAYDEFIKNTPQMFYSQNIINKAFNKYSIPKTKSNINKFKRIDSFLNRK